MVDKNIPGRRSYSSVDIPARGGASIDQIRVTDPAEARPVREFSERVPSSGFSADIFAPLTRGLTDIADRRHNEKKQIEAKLLAKQEAEAGEIQKQIKANENLGHILGYSQATATVKEQYNVDAQENPDTSAVTALQQVVALGESAMKNLEESDLDPLQKLQLAGEYMKRQSDLVQYISDNDMKVQAEQSILRALNTAQEGANSIMKAKDVDTVLWLLGGITVFGDTPDKMARGLMSYTGSYDASMKYIKIYASAVVDKANIYIIQGEYDKARELIDKTASLVTSMGMDPVKMVKIVESAESAQQSQRDTAYTMGWLKAKMNGTEEGFVENNPPDTNSKKQVEVFVQAKGTVDKDKAAALKAEEDAAKKTAAQNEATTQRELRWGKGTTEQQEKVRTAELSVIIMDIENHSKQSHMKPYDWLSTTTALRSKIFKFVDNNMGKDLPPSIELALDHLAAAHVGYVLGPEGSKQLVGFKADIMGNIQKAPDFDITAPKARELFKSVYRSTLMDLINNPSRGENIAEVFYANWSAATEKQKKPTPPTNGVWGAIKTLQGNNK